MCLDVPSEHILGEMVPNVRFPIFPTFFCLCVCIFLRVETEQRKCRTMIKYSEQDQSSRLEETLRGVTEVGLRGDDDACWGRKYLFWGRRNTPSLSVNHADPSSVDKHW